MEYYISYINSIGTNDQQAFPPMPGHKQGPVDVESWQFLFFLPLCSFIVRSTDYCFFLSFSLSEVYSYPTSLIISNQLEVPTSS